MPLGAFEVTALLDGTVALPVRTMHDHTTPERVDASLATAFLRSPLALSVNAYLVNTGDRLVLIDAGTSDLLGPALGALPAALRASGYRPDDVDAVLLTHIHTDHSGGLMLHGERVFPNATVHANAREAGYWLDAGNLDRASEAGKRPFREAAASIGPYQRAGRFRTFEDNASPVASFGSILRPGHTPGHSSIVVESGGETMVAWGDTTHGDVVQFREPGVGISFDVDSRAAAATRALAFQDAADRRYWVAGAHVSFPGIGHVRRGAAGYEWVPANHNLGT